LNASSWSCSDTNSFSLLPSSKFGGEENDFAIIPYPFGIGSSCYLEKSYEIKCRSTTSSRKQAPFLSLNSQEVEVVKISLPSEGSYYTFFASYVRSVSSVSILWFSSCENSNNFRKRSESIESIIMNLTSSPFFIDDVNSLIAVGCNAKVSLTHVKPNMVGCDLICNTSKDHPSKTIPFLDKTGCSSNSLSYKYADCTENKIEEEEPECDGNAYTPDGCEDVDECKITPPICGEGEGYTCVNTQGSYRFVADKKKSILIGVGAGFGVLALVGGVWWLRKFLINRKITKRKKMFFHRNGDLLLQQELSTSEGRVEKTRIFSSIELEKATENFSENRVLGQGGQGTVYKVKKSKVIDEDKLQEFINEVVILSQINHRHVVKLLGCCLETEVPMLVYEFIINGNLFKHIHEESDDYAMIWGMRLRIAVDVAGALSYLHTSASSPIYHRDIKSTNILLDEKYRAKVADFGTSRSVTIDQTHWTTVVSSTVGYLDPEYYQSSQYTEKSDVYSFGVVLVQQIQIDEEEEDEEEGRDLINERDSWSVSVTAPALASSSSDVEPLNMSDENTKCSILLILLKVLLLLILYSEDVAASSSCQSQCGGVTIQYPFGIGKGCYLEKSYEIKCLSSTTSGKLAPFLYITDNNREVVNISLPEIEAYSPNEPLYLLSFGSVRVKIPITSSGCGVKESPESLLNFTGTPFFIDYQNSLVAVGSNAKVSLTHVEPNIVGCELTSNTGKYQSSNSVPFLKNTQCLASSQSYLYGACPLYNEDVKECNGSGCCKVGLREHQQAIGIRIESNDSTTTREEKCRVAFLTIESYTSSNATNPQELFDKGYATLSLGWVIQTKNHSFVSSLSCDNRDVYENTTYAAVSQRKCICGKSTIAKISYAHCSCKRGYTGNAYDPHGCQDVNECKTEHISCEGMNTCVNTEGGHHCAGDKKKAILIGLGSGFGALALVSGVWWLRKFLIKRRMTKQKNKFFKRNGGLLLQQQLYTRDGNVETTKIFSSGELEKATENFSENRVLGQGGQGTVYKGMLHIHEESDDYSMIWGMRLRIAVDVAGALSYLHSSASSPIYHRDIKSTNILLDEKHRAKYYRSSQFTEKSDVYSFGVVLAELITGDKPVVTIQNTRETISLSEHFKLAVKKKRLSDVMDARIKEDCKMKQVMAVANLAVKCLSSKGNKRPNMREVFTELERISASPEDSHVQVMIDEDEDEEDEEEEVTNMVNRGNSLRVGLTAPALGIVASPSSSNAESLIPRPTW
ncbi:LOW QUALITY PROTEIN: hypothetical protein HID58_000620, partial [Brassica napus]